YIVEGTFVFVSFSTLSSELRGLPFLPFLTIYLVTLMGNVLIILATTADSVLQNPMYFFLRNLSFLEIGLSLVIVPKMLGTLIIQDTTISFLGCGTQLYFFSSLGLLSAVSWPQWHMTTTWPSATLCATQSL
uniref:G-protein coupled receptors family 1 profile domain-containing protein n=1 Tax=Ursus americanus TaxID=9643 RepID=A0A452RA49_URSAM